MGINSLFLKPPSQKKEEKKEEEKKKGRTSSGQSRRKGVTRIRGYEDMRVYEGGIMTN